MKLKVKKVIQRDKFANTENEKNDLEIDSQNIFLQCEDRILLENNKYKEIFGKYLGDSKHKSSKRGVVKITMGKQSLYRLLQSGNSHGIKNDVCGLHKYDYFGLGLGKTNNFVEITAGNRFWFYWYHPHDPTRLSFRLPLFSIIISIIITYLLGKIF